MLFLFFDIFPCQGLATTVVDDAQEIKVLEVERLLLSELPTAPLAASASERTADDALYYVCRLSLVWDC